MKKEKKERHEKMKEEKEKLAKPIHEFKAFISRGNVVDMAIGVIIGSAFGKIVTSLVNDVLMPLIGVLLGGLDFSKLSIQIKDATIAYGSFIQSIVDFLIIAICIFVMVKVLTMLKREHKKETEPPKKPREVELLEEIRDLLKKQK